MQDAKRIRDNAQAIKFCLDYLAREARDAGLQEVARFIDLAAMAAEEMAPPLH